MQSQMLSQLSPVGLEHLGLIVCTRNRATPLFDLLNSIGSGRAAPKVVAIADSNSTEVTAHASSQRGPAGPLAIDFLRSEPGIPNQRISGIAAIIEIDAPPPKPDDLRNKTASTRQEELVTASR
jgi:hypothetical protein